MSANAAVRPSPTPTANLVIDRAFKLLHRLCRIAADWFTEFVRRQRLAARHARFAEGDERALKDLGISRAQARYYATERPLCRLDSAPDDSGSRACRGDSALMSGSLQAGPIGPARSAERSPSGFDIAEPIRRVWTVWRARAANRRAWWRADDHILRDVGLTRAEVRREASKPCWRK